MSFENEHHRTSYEKVKTYLSELFEPDNIAEDDGHFYVSYGSTVLEISIEPYGPEETIVMVMAYCVQGVEGVSELQLALLELNHTLPIGAFSLVKNDIFFSHAVFGKTLERSNLLGTLAAVATISDDYDDRIADEYGGQRALDRIRDTGGRRRRRAAVNQSAEPS